jgi:hypothetical protein
MADVSIMAGMFLIFLQFFIGKDHSQ